MDTELAFRSDRKGDKTRHNHQTWKSKNLKLKKKKKHNGNKATNQSTRFT